MNMEHRFVKISYTGRIKDGAVYDTTDIETAKKENIFDEKRLYRPVPVIIGAGHVLKGLDDALKDMKAGEEKELELTPENAYGIRDPNLIRLVPMKAFKDQKMMPVPGMVIELDGRPARIQTVSGGRVRVDFNSELAGKTVSYKIKLEEEAKTEKQKIDLLIERSFYTTEGFETKITEKSIEVSIPEKSQRDRSLLVRKASFVSEVYRFTDIENVTFTETWKKKGKDEKPEAVAPEEIEENAGF
jgi:FKBP-type peptidyl-prolyl cis-trans isomerase SlyD